MYSFSRDLIQDCRRKLLSLRENILNRIKAAHSELNIADKMSGDEIDQTVAQLAENTFLVNQERLRRQLIEIDSALARIEMNQYGICEETLEPIEPDRLRAIPYTRLSIEGAEIREALNKKYARI